MSEFQRACKERESRIDRKAADLVRDGVSPWEAYRMAADIVDRTPRRTVEDREQSIDDLFGRITV